MATKKKSKRKNPTTYGTSYFVSKSAAIRYYKPYHYEDTAQAVARKIREGEIHIGRPSYDAKAGERLTLVDGGKRYAITKSNPVKKLITIKFQVPTMADARRAIKKLKRK